MRDKPILCVDFDGVIHKYVSGWQGIDVISDPPVDGAFDFLKAALEFFEISIYSSRSKEKLGRDAMMMWFIEKGWTEEIVTSADIAMKYPLRDRIGKGISRPEHLKFPGTKPSAFLTIDDRCRLFKGEFPKPEDLLNFQTWTQRPV